MPSIAQFIKELLSEHQYSSDFNDKIHERIKFLNAAQLQGMYHHLQNMVKTSHSELWRNANLELIQKIEDVMVVRIEEEKLEHTMLEESILKEKHKKDMTKEKKIEEKRVQKMIKEKAFQTAEDEIIEQEEQRKINERVEIIQKINTGEERRNRWWFITIVLMIILIIGAVIILRNDSQIMLAVIIVIVVISLLFIYRAYRFTVVVPLLKTDEMLNNEINEKAELLIKKAISDLQEKERKFIEQQKKEDQERRRIRKEKKERDRLEAEMIEKRRLEQIHLAKEALRKASASIDGSRSMNSSVDDRDFRIRSGIVLGSNDSSAGRSITHEFSALRHSVSGAVAPTKSISNHKNGMHSLRNHDVKDFHSELQLQDIESQHVGSNHKHHEATHHEEKNETTPLHGALESPTSSISST